MGLDVSGSVNADEYRLQLDGLAGALQSDDVRDILLSNPDAPVRLAVYEWSGDSDQRVLLPWVGIDGPDALNSATARLNATGRSAAAPSTALGAALATGLIMLDQQPDCWVHTLDISGDGKSNTGPRPQDISPDLGPDGAIVNGLVIGLDEDGSGGIRVVQIGELSSYYHAYVIRGPGAFVETAVGFQNYQEAMTRKLLRELQSLAIGAIPGPARMLPDHQG